MKKLNKLFICVLTVLITVLYSGLPVKAEEQYTVTFDPNGGTMENIKTATKTSGSTYGFLSGEGKNFASTADDERLGYANYDFGSAITISTKVSFDTFDKGDQDWFNNYENAGFGFGYNKSRDCFCFGVHTNGAYHKVFVKRQFSKNETFWLTGVYDTSSDRMEVYINGELQSPYEYVHSSQKGSITVSPVVFSDGGNPTSDENFEQITQFYGTLYKAGLWTTAMSQEQITDMVNNDYINSAALINLDYVPRRVGYSFDGWHEDVNNPSTKITSTAKVAKNTTLHAKWTAHSYTVQYKPNGATSGAVADTTHSYNDDSTLATNSFERPGYVFGGWNTELDGSGKTYYSGQKVSNLTDKNGDTVKLYAVWAPDADVFNFTIPTEITASSDGTGKINGDIQFTTTTEKRRWLDVSITSGDEFALVDDHDSNNKINYSLSETSFKVEPQYRDSDSKSFARDIKLSGDDTSIAGKYSDTVNFNVSSYYETRTIVLDCDGGNVKGDSQIMYTVRDGSTYGKLPLPTRNGYQFLKWRDNDGNTIYSGSVVSSSTEKLTAEWLPYRVFCFESFINGIQNEYLMNVGTFDVFENGTQIRRSSYSMWTTGIAGTVFECNNFKIGSKFKYVGVHGGKLPDGVTVSTDNDGNITSIQAILQENSDCSFSLDFVTSTPLQDIIDSCGATSLIFDRDKPDQTINVVGTLNNIFETAAEAYIQDKELHLFNPNGGKLKAPQNSNNLLSYTLVDTIDANNLDVSNVEAASYMFANCSKSKQIQVQNWNTSNIRYFQNMFYGCSSLDTLDVNRWDVSSALNITMMFSYSGIKSIDLSEWDVSRITSFEKLFFNCTQLKNLDLHTWDTSSVTNLYWTFRSCNSLEIIDVTDWNTSHVNAMDRIFGECRKLTTIKGLNNFDTSNVETIEVMFLGDYSLKELDLSSFDTSKCKRFGQMFRYCSNLKTIYVSEKFSLEKATSTSQMFNGCTSLVGGAGTVFDPTFIDATAARIDGGSENPGYFTDIKDKPAESVADQTASDESAIDIPTVGDYIEDESQEQQIETTAPAPAATPSADNSEDEESTDTNN